MESKDNILNYVKQKTLKNYFTSDRDFLSLFPEDNFNFNESKYSKFLYFGKEEALAYLKDFLLFIKKYYKREVFSFQNYFSIFDEFKKYLDKNNIFFYAKTKMGLNIANYSSELLLKTLKHDFGDELFLGDDKKIAFSSQLSLPESFTYSFFDWLCEKLDGYNNYKCTVEPLLKDDIENIKNFYKGIEYPGKLPFFLDTTKSTWKDFKNIILSDLVSDSPDKVFLISKNLTPVALVIAKVVKTTCDLTIICDNDYYDSDISYPLDFICDEIFEKLGVSKIVTINNNRGIAYSGINSCLVMIHFKPDYSLGSDYTGYSKIKYELTYDDNKETSKYLDNSIIKFAI